MNKQEIEKAIECCERYKGVAETYGSKKSAKEDKRLIDLAISALEKQLTNGWIPVSDKHPVKHEDELEEQFRNICQELFKDCETEQDLNERYEELRQIIVCEMSDRAEYLGIDPDTL